MAKKELKNALKTLDLTEKEAKVYLSALELGEGTVQEIAKKSGVARTSIYNFIDDLEKKGVISKINKEKHFLIAPEDPEILLNKIENKAEKFRNLIPEFLSIDNQSENKPKIKFYEGLENGVHQIWNDILRTPDIVREMADYNRVTTAISNEVYRNYIDERVDRNLEAKIIAKAEPNAFNLKKKDDKELRETRLVESGIFETEIFIYRNKVALISFKQEPYMGVVIEDEKINKTMKWMFDMIWKSLK
ncbi:MAG: TrmB family transcriptional regulator [Candidatus Magasanikbacteria bacterium]